MLFHEQLGRSGPALVGLHGLASANRLLSLRLAPLADGARLFCPDLLGHGRSPWPDCAYGIRDHLNAFQTWRSGIGLATESVYLVGVSLGAVLALHYAAYEQEWYGSSTVRGVAALSTPAYPYPAHARAVLSRAVPIVWLILHHPRIAAWLCHVLCGVGGLGWTLGPRLAPWLPSDIVQDNFAHCWQSLSRTLEEVVLAPRLNEALDRLRNIPLLFIHGERDRLAPLASLEAVLAGRPSARLRVLPATDHDAIVARTPLVLDALREFISS